MIIRRHSTGASATFSNLLITTILRDSTSDMCHIIMMVVDMLALNRAQVISSHNNYDCCDKSVTVSHIVLQQPLKTVRQVCNQCFFFLLLTGFCSHKDDAVCHMHPMVQSVNTNFWASGPYLEVNTGFYYSRLA